jgi:hypothetical protein
MAIQGGYTFRPSYVSTGFLDPCLLSWRVLYKNYFSIRLSNREVIDKFSLSPYDYIAFDLRPRYDQLDLIPDAVHLR